VLGDQERRIVLKPVRWQGFTLVELVVSLSIIAILAAFGLPAMGTYLQNSKLANAAASYYSGIQLARAEAIRRNVETQFVLTGTAITTATLPGGGNEEYVIDISNPAAGPCGPIHCRRIRISQGGQVQSCDLSAAVGDSRAC
jgi:prepilin-type N-terminal cleavage/methylation domain-containing protein